MRYLSLFSGIGGFELGIERANPEAQCVGYSEIDKYAVQIYEQHFPTHTNIGDVTAVDPVRLADFDLLVGGFPCQAFSIAGKRRGFDDTRGTLFFDIARILREKRPRFCVLENVKGLLSHDSGRTFKVIIATLTELGYDVQWQVLNSKDFGVPQNRERVYIVGHLRGQPRPEVFPLGGNSSQDTSPTLRATYYKGYQTRGPMIFARTVRSGGRSSLHGSKQNWDSYEVEGQIRRLTPTECERLQGFPDGWTEGVSDTQRYKTLGNAVTVNVVEAVMRRLTSSQAFASI